METVLRENYKDRVSSEQIDKATKSLTTQIKNSFDNIEFNLDRIKNISRAIVENTIPTLDEKNLSSSVSRLINRNDLKEIIQQVREHGPMQDNLMKRKIQAMDNPD